MKCQNCSEPIKSQRATKKFCSAGCKQAHYRDTRARIDVAALFVREDSPYKAIPHVDCFDRERDGLTFKGSVPVICHPPCRRFGKLRHFSKASISEERLAHFSVERVRLNGGILEHPVDSKLWIDAELPYPGDYDEFGGWTLEVAQNMFGHRARKMTFFKETRRSQHYHAQSIGFR